jgi:hypothetical protein
MNLEPDDPRHGTYAGWNAHRVAGTMACRDCLDAAAAYARARRTRKDRKARQVSVAFPISDERHLVSDFDSLGAVIARAWRESA